MGWNVLRRGDQINLEQKPSRKEVERETKSGRKTGKLKIRKMGVTMTMKKKDLFPSGKNSLNIGCL